MYNLRIGIDPGLDGAFAMLGEGHASVHDMPTSAKVHGKGRQVDASGAHFILTTYSTVIDWDDLTISQRPTVYLEQVNAMPKQGVTGVFSLGRSLGVIEGVVGALRFPLVMVRPQAWKRRAGLLKADKAASVTLARQLWPQLGDELSAGNKKRDEGRAEALLIARFGEE